MWLCGLFESVGISRVICLWKTMGVGLYGLCVLMARYRDCINCVQYILMAGYRYDRRPPLATRQVHNTEHMVYKLTCLLLIIKKKWQVEFNTLSWYTSDGKVNH